MVFLCMGNSSPQGRSSMSTSHELLWPVQLVHAQGGQDGLSAWGWVSHHSTSLGSGRAWAGSQWVKPLNTK
jgi:hypothetical protein